MNAYEYLISEYDDSLTIIEKDFKSKAKGLCKGNKIGINKAVETSTEKRCILAEELGHHYTTVGNILDQSSVLNRKQELRARIWAYEKLLSLSQFIKAYEYGCQNQHEIADYLDVTEEFLLEAIERYRAKYGVYTQCKEYKICFEPHFAIYKTV